MKNLITLIMLLTSLNAMSGELTSNEYEYCDSTLDSIQCEEYIKECSESNEYTVEQCADTYQENNDV